MQNDKCSIVLAALLAFAFTVQPAHAGVTLDGTLGNSGAIVGPNYAITADLGKQVGANLFHSFSQFNLVKGDIATFSGPNNIINIISRVTGGTASSIDGTIKSTISGANMYLINPYGVMFGPNSSIDIGGSLHVTTADYLKLGTDGRFDATTPANSILTVSPPSAFGFVSTKPAGIEVNGAGSNYAYSKYGLNGLYVKAGNTISLIGGDISIHNGIIDDLTSSFILTARKGRLNMASVASSGEVVVTDSNLAMNGFTALGNISLSGNATGKPLARGLDIQSGQIDLNPRPLLGPAGSVYIRGNNLTCSNFIIESVSNDIPGSGLFDISLTGNAVLENSKMNSAGSQFVTANNITIDSLTQLITYGYDGLRLNATGTLSLTGKLSSMMSDNIKTGSIQLTGSDLIIAPKASITSEKGIVLQAKGDITIFGTLDSSTRNSIDAGTITAHANNIVINDGATLRTTNYYKGKSGAIELTAQNQMIVDGKLDSNSTGTGDSGNIVITTGTYSQKGKLTSGGLNGKPGNISINASGAVDILSDIRATSFSYEGSGNITVQTRGDLTVKGYLGGESMLYGKSGSISLAGRNVNIQNTIVTSVASSIGNAGDITISALESLNIDAKVSSIAINGKGKGGNIALTAKICLSVLRAK